MRPIQIWVPDTKRPEFVRECRRQSLLLQNDVQEREVLDFIAAASDTEGWE
ncbi:antitoxin MazE family protein [Aminivibrio pyruvatiphilus]|nr:antitoxin MazE family protein [Aminivibrio pyruvatiphilus]